MDPEHEKRWTEYCNRHRCDSQSRGSVYDSKAGQLLTPNGVGIRKSHSYKYCCIRAAHSHCHAMWVRPPPANSARDMFREAP